MKNLPKYLLSIFIVTSLLLADGTQPPGSGTSGDPYLISTMQHLIWISTNPNSWSSDFLQTENIDIIEIDDYDGGAGFRPIGNYANVFTGTYDGGGHYVDYLYINRPSTSPVGMFGSIGNATIQNLGITNPTIVGQWDVGTLVGLSNSSQIDNCYTTGPVAASIKGSSKTGGLIGNSIGSRVTNSFSTLQVTGSNHSIGGFIGMSQDGSGILNCYSTGFVFNESGTGGSIGGFVGENTSSTIQCSYSTGTVEGDYTNIGGFVGLNRANALIENCYSRGDVTTSNPQVTVGAFCGYIGNSPGTIKNSYSTGSVYYTNAADPTDRGFVGWDIYNQQGNFSNNFWDSETSNQETAIGATGLNSGDAQNFIAYIDAGWDFIGETANGTNDYWNIDYAGLAKSSNNTQNSAAINDGYPIFTWQSSAIPEIRIIVDGVEFYNGQRLDFGFVNLGSSKDVEVTVENTGSADLHLFPLPEIVTPYTNYFSFITQPTLPVPPGGSTTFTIRLTIPGGFGKFSDIMEGTYIEIPNNDRDENPFKISMGATTPIGELAIKNEENEGMLPNQFTILSAYPNPFNPSTTITYGIYTEGQVNIQIYNITGKLINTLQNENQTQGWHSVQWNGTNQQGEQAPAGMYLSRITADNEVKSMKLMLLK